MDYKFKLEKKKSHVLKKLIEVMAGVVDETIFKVNSEEFAVTAIDPGRNCLLKLVMPKECFSEFGCKKGDEFETSINLSDLDKILKRCTAEDSVELASDTKQSQLKVSMERSGKNRKRTFRLTEIDIDFEALPIDEMLKHDYSAGFGVEPELFDEAVKDAEIYSEVITIIAKKDEKIEFLSEGVIGSMNYEVGLEDLENAEIDKDCEATFGLVFLKNIFKISSIVDKLTIAISNDHPMAMIISLEGGGVLYYLVAPRVDYEEED